MHTLSLAVRLLFFVFLSLAFVLKFIFCLFVCEGSVRCGGCARKFHTKIIGFKFKCTQCGDTSLLGEKSCQKRNNSSQFDGVSKVQGREEGSHSLKVSHQRMAGDCYHLLISASQPAASL